MRKSKIRFQWNIKHLLSQKNYFWTWSCTYNLNLQNLKSTSCFYPKLSDICPSQTSITLSVAWLMWVALSFHWSAVSIILKRIRNYINADQNLFKFNYTDNVRNFFKAVIWFLYRGKFCPYFTICLIFLMDDLEKFHFKGNSH